MVVAVAAVAATVLLLLLLRGAGRRPGRPVTLRDPQAKYPLPLVGKEVSVERPEGRYAAFAAGHRAVVCQEGRDPCCVPWSPALGLLARPLAEGCTGAGEDRAVEGQNSLVSKLRAA